MESIQRASIVILGNFNPVIFQPEWFRRFKILPEQEIAAALEEKVIAKPSANVQIVSCYTNIISTQKTELNFPSYGLKAQPARFEFYSDKKSCFQELAESAIKIFELLSHTPVNSIGLNFLADFAVENVENTLKALFPTSPEIAKEAFGEQYKVGGKFFFNHNNCNIQVLVQHSDQIENGIHINFNFSIKVVSHNTEELLSAIRENYDSNLKEAEKITQTLLNIKKDIFL